MNRATIIRAALATIFTAGAILLGAEFQAAAHPLPATVCHAATEDSWPADCDYRNGGWHQN